MTAIVIGNDGPLIQTTNYYDSEAASRGLLYVSWNANAARVLVPDSQLAMVAEMKTGKECIVSAGPTERGLAYELLFEEALLIKSKVGYSLPNPPGGLS